MFQHNIEEESESASPKFPKAEGAVRSYVLYSTYVHPYLLTLHISFKFQTTVAEKVSTFQHFGSSGHSRLLPNNKYEYVTM
jgi:hypothetical protein